MWSSQIGKQVKTTMEEMFRETRRIKTMRASIKLKKY